MAGTLVVYRQLHYMTTQYPGVATNQVLVLEAPVKPMTITGNWKASRTN